MTLSATCSTSLARAREILCWSQVSNRRRSFLTICGPKPSAPVAPCTETWLMISYSVEG